MDREKIVVSVITVVYNGIGTMPSLLASVARLLERTASVEHIIVDGRSSDGTVALLQEHCARYENVRFVSEKDSGIYDAMNKGAQLASGKYIVHINADDVLVNVAAWLEVCRNLQQNAPQLLASPVPIIDPQSEKVLRILPSKPLNKFHRKFGFHFPHQGTFIKKTLWEKLGKYDQRIGYVADKIFFFLALDKVPLSEISYFDGILTHQYAGGISSKNLAVPLKTIYLTLAARRHVPFKSAFLRAFMNPVFKVLYYKR